MKVPGFTAEAALYKPRWHYKQHNTSLVHGTGGVVPATGQCCAPCGEDLCCDDCPPEPPPDGGDDRGRFRRVRFV